MNAITVKPAVADYPQSDLDRLKSSQSEDPAKEKVRLKKAAKEFESFFMYQMLKTMRKTVPESSFSQEGAFKGGMGKDIFTDMFDMQMSKKMVGNGNQSIAQLLYNSLEKLIDVKAQQPTEDFKIAPYDKSQKAIPLQPHDIPYKPSEPMQKLPEEKSLFQELTPRIGRVSEDTIMSKYGDIIDEAAKTHNLDPKIIRAVINAESSGNAKAVSPAGAKGLMQLIDSTASAYGVEDQFDPRQNIMGGSKYLRELLDRFESLPLALAAYNAGPGNVAKYNGIPPFKETEQYVIKVIDSLQTDIPGGR